MSTVTIAVDLAKNAFELAIASRAGTIRQRKRLSRSPCEQFWGTQTPCRVVMEACASSHFWGRYLRARGFAVILLPPHDVKPYRRRNKRTAPIARRSSRPIAAPAFIRSASRAKTSRR